MAHAEDPELRRLLDTAAIRELLLRYGRGCDRMDRDLLTSLFHPDAVDHHGTFDGPALEFVDYALTTALPRYLATEHYLSNCTVEVEGDTARAETYLVATHVKDADGGQLRVDTSHGRLIDYLERRGGRWGIVERTFLHDWDQSELVTPNPTWAGTFASGSRSRTDPSYRRGTRA
jgi:hypothetical protein